MEVHRRKQQAGKESESDLLLMSQNYSFWKKIPLPSKPRALRSLGHSAGAQSEPAHANPGPKSGDRQGRAASPPSSRKLVIWWCVLTSNTSISRSAAGTCLLQSGIDEVPSEAGFICSSTGPAQNILPKQPPSLSSSHIDFCQ